ncbi:hypothetical protein ES332_D13G106700v1 [Gossypium tomentosum]|uniref:Uncharacterized protein n=1 Tax=Gossypium tomentosum TaxID=34277 RepID=A0A5D2HVC4_GOSTO|nr:hypothetical protein ES332_D13G106700v1 [Gossypium tomentosum]
MIRIRHKGTVVREEDAHGGNACMRWRCTSEAWIWAEIGAAALGFSY